MPALPVGASVPMLWVDQLGFGLARPTGVTPPAMAAYRGGTFYFEKWADGDQVWYFIQLNHQYKSSPPAGALTPHIHWVHTSAGAPDNPTRFVLEYMWAPVGGDFPAVPTSGGNTGSLVVTAADIGKHQMADFPVITPNPVSDMGVSSILVARVVRDDPGAAAAGDIFVVGFDLHLQHDTGGSVLVGAKFG